LSPSKHVLSFVDGDERSPFDDAQGRPFDKLRVSGEGYVATVMVEST
jgi:hypothetical protein